jgi:L-alanine-DL-glutamate epimerase-like enolase superfamily enzyme
LLQGRAGSVVRALSIIDVALWDRNARAAGLPLARYLGGMTAERVPAYASGGYYCIEFGEAARGGEHQAEHEGGRRFRHFARRVRQHDAASREFIGESGDRKMR